ncbi:uncharacterized protein LOC131208347 [Anopheles bellator]|uniref:uncharacterized protein LOC131208347 n=1 Tax=Anopheles bellator TaxID=139047 RepID=UPI0026498E29|nr:uncharacterized protein LOC131208347 [Anopheles bellator]
MAFEYDQFFHEETFVIDNFGEICEDIVRIAGASSQYFYKEFDADHRHDSPPPGNYTAASRCFEKEVPSLFSEMEYLTEVSPETEISLTYRKPVPVSVNPIEFSYKRHDQLSLEPFSEKYLESPQPVPPPDRVADASYDAGNMDEDSSHDAAQSDGLAVPTEYKRILNNYIQKGRKKLEASSYSKMKATCLAKEKINARSTSVIETVAVTMANDLPEGRPRSNTATAVPNPHSLPTGQCQSFIPTTATSIHQSIVIEPYSQLPQSQPKPAKARGASVNNRTASSSPKTTRTYRCQDCGASFPSSDRLRKHTCIIDEQYQCHMCLREFKKRKTLEHHMKSHDKVFSTDDDLRK